MKIKIINRSKHEMPGYSTISAAGMDIKESIDADYRGEGCIILINLSDENFVIKNGDRICQMIISKHKQAEWINVNNLIETERGSDRFGHTGKK